jgi:hypothetical protein
MTPAEFLFVVKYRELCRILDNLEVTELLALSGILRLFLVDSPNIVDRVNRNHRLKIRFLPMGDDPNHIKNLPASLPIPAFQYFGFFSDTTEAKITRDQLLKRVAFIIEGRQYTYHQFIILVANKLGGVHFDEDYKKQPDLAVLASLNEQIGIGGAPSALWVMRDVGKVVREGFADLFACVQG